MTIIKELRKSSGVTQQQLASMLGITRGAFANIEDGRREPDISTLIRLADYFNVSVDYLINHEKGDLTMSDERRTFFNENGWPDDITEDYENARSDEERIRILELCGYDKAHLYAARHFFPKQFQKEPTPVPEDGQNYNIIQIAGRDGSFTERKLTDEQVAALKLIIDQLPDADNL